VPRTASGSEIKRAYYQAAKKFHPDTNKGDPQAAKRFAEVTEAYEILTDSEKRKVYDTYGHAGLDGGAGGGGGFQQGGFPGGFQFHSQGGSVSPEELFEQFERVFGGSGMFGNAGSRRSRRGRDVQVSVSLGFMEAVEGCKRTVSWRSPSEGARTVEVDIPAGVDSGMSLRLTGEGESGDAGRGHVYVQIVVGEHEVFERSGSDVHVRVRLSLAEAILGGSVIVPTLSGQVSLKVPEGTQHGDRRVMQGRGIRAADGSGQGHQYIYFEVPIPRKLSPQQRKLIEQFGEEQKIDPEERSTRSDSGTRQQRGSAFG